MCLTPCPSPCASADVGSVGLRRNISLADGITAGPTLQDHQRYAYQVIQPEQLQQVWIGAHDAGRSDRFTWNPDNRSLDAFHFWQRHEPNHITRGEEPEEENCVAMSGSAEYAEDTARWNSRMCRDIRAGECLGESHRAGNWLVVHRDRATPGCGVPPHTHTHTLQKLRLTLASQSAVPLYGLVVLQGQM